MVTTTNLSIIFRIESAKCFQKLDSPDFHSNQGNLVWTDEHAYKLTAKSLNFVTAKKGRTGVTDPGITQSFSQKKKKTS